MKTAMIWGANGGIGQALVAQLIAADWTVIAVTRQPELLVGLSVHTIEADVTDDFSVQQAVMLAAREAEEINLWIYAVGDIATAKVADMAPGVWSRILTANLSGAYLVTHHSLPLLAPDAHLVYLGAIHERLRLPGLTAYAAAKAGLEAFAEALGKEERQRRVTLVRPGAVATPLWSKAGLKLPAIAISPETLAQRILEAHESGHKGILTLD